MKKIGMLLFAGLLVACNSKSKVSDGETVADNEEKMAEEVVEPGISDEVKNFTSPDLTLNMLHSKVDYVVTTTYATEKVGERVKQGAILTIDTLQFDSEGRMIRKHIINKDKNKGWYASEETKYNYTPEGKFKDAGNVIICTDGDKLRERIEVKRNANGYITKLTTTRIPSNDEANHTEEYEWDKGLLKAYTYNGWEWTYGYTYKYDDNGFLSTENCGYSEEGDFSTTTTSYNYPSLDECGNWTKRSITEEVISGHSELTTNDDGTSNFIEVYDDTIYNYRIEVRKIVYQK